MTKDHNSDEISIALTPLSAKQIKGLKKDDMALLLLHEQKLRLQLQALYTQAQKANVELQDKKLFLEDKFVLLKNKLFGKSSERDPKPKPNGAPKPKKGKKKKDKKQKPSERYPDLPLIERELSLADPPNCELCQSPMRDSGMVESCEFLTVTPANFAVVEQNRHKYRCSKCHGDIQTTPAPPRICHGSAYSDEMILDVALSKYCDLIPIERYVSIAARKGVKGLPPQSLIQLTHHLANFVTPAYSRIREDILSSRMLCADETPHRMLEGGGDKQRWYLWAVSNAKSCYYTVKDTRSGDVVIELLSESKCEKLLTDDYSGYDRAIKIINEQRETYDLPLVVGFRCNAHARRKFKDAKTNYPEAERFIELYRKIYRLEQIAQKRPFNRILKVRKRMAPIFGEMMQMCTELKDTVSSKGLLATAMNYFFSNFTALTRFVTDPEVPIDNNAQERRMRNPVIGRKTWYGNHSIRGAKTSTILFTLVETCKLCKVNPREYFRSLVEDLHAKKPPRTPAEFALTMT